VQQPPAGEAGVASPRRRPGRPPGHPAWNKGLALGETHRKRISIQMKAKWKDPEYKRAVSESMTVGEGCWPF
jgi:hypothetical protein